MVVFYFKHAHFISSLSSHKEGKQHKRRSIIHNTTSLPPILSSKETIATMNDAGNAAQRKRKDIQKHARFRFEDDFVSKHHKLIQQNSGHAGTQNAYIEQQTQLIKESMEIKKTPDGLTYHLWGDGYKKTISWDAYLLGSKDSETVIAVKYYLDLKEIAKQAETEATNNKHMFAPLFQALKPNSIENPSGFVAQMQTFAFRKDATEENFRRDNVGRVVGNHQNTNSPGKPKETPRTGCNNSVANVDDSPKELDSVPRRRLFNTGGTRSNPVGSTELIVTSGHELLRMGERSIFLSECLQIIEQGTIVPNPRHPDKINYELHGKVVSVLKRDHHSSTKRICTVFDRHVSTEKERIENFLKQPIRSEYENDDEYKKDYTTYLRAKKEVAKKYFKAENEINRLKNRVAHHEDHWDVDYLDQSGHNDSKRRRNDLHHGPNKRQRRDDDDYHHDNRRQRQGGSGYRGHSNNESLRNNRSTASRRRSTGSGPTNSSRNNYSPHRKQD